jgi:HEAT repeats
MTSSRVFGIAGAACVRIAAIAVLLLVIAHSAPARADNVDELIRQLESDSDKVRLSAALNLAKLGEQRAILPLVKAIGNDSEPSVRGAAAVGLGALINDKTKPSIKNLAISALKKAASDDSDIVRGQADKALKAIGVTGSQPPTTPPINATAIYVNVGPMSAKTGDSAADPKLKALMAKVATRTLTRVATGMAITWPGGQAPTKAMLDAKATVGFYIDGTVNELKSKESGSTTTVSCKINMLLASYPDKSIFGLLNGGASVQASGRASDIALAREDCVSAVVEDLIAKKIVPTIHMKAGVP